jgi:hypothetical protein
MPLRKGCKEIVREFFGRRKREVGGRREDGGGRESGSSDEGMKQARRQNEGG